MSHQLINTGAGWRCLRCQVAWDQGDDAPEDCVAGAEYGFATDLPKEPVTTTFIFASGDTEYLKNDAGDRRFWPIVEPLPEDDEIVVCQIPAKLDLPDTPEMRQYVEQIERYCNSPVVVTEVYPKPAAMTRMIGGTHYSKLVIQPTEFCMRNGLDFCVGSILKYLTRWRSKNGLEDIRKAKHFVEIREAFPHDIHPPRQIAITMLEYVTRNNIRPDDAEALYRLEAYYNAAGHHARIGADRLMLEIDRLADRAALT